MLLELELNENQRRALEAEGAPLLVLAGPGSGKTQVLTLRVARIIESSPERHFRVLGLTFTNKAAGEMRTRVQQLLGNGTGRALLTTFHSFAADVLRQHGSHIGVQPDFAILSQEADREAVLLEAILSAQDKRPDLERADVRLLPLIDNLLSKLVPEDGARERIRDPELAEKIDFLYRGYRARLREGNELDFATLLCFAYELLEERPAVAKQLRSVYRHILVDEFQDTNFAQVEFLRRLVGDDPWNLFVVADDDQIIYAWNGADPQRLDELRAAYSMEVIQLPTNYRCPPAVIELANALIVHNHDRARGKEPLVAGVEGESEGCVSVESFASMEQELEWVAGEIADMPASERGDCVVLARTRRLLEEAQAALEEAQVEAVLVVRKGDFTSAPFRWLTAMLRLAAGRADREHLRVVCKAFFQLEGLNLLVDDVIASSAARGGDMLRSFLEEATARDSLEVGTRRFLECTLDTLAERMRYEEFIEDSLAWFSTVQESPAAADRAFGDFQVESDIWHEIVRQTRGRYGSELSLSGFLQELDLSPKALPIPPGAVRCFTVHNAKGMEFPRVYLIGLAEDLLPSYHAIKKGAESLEMQEERRNCFVAITRTRERLTMTYGRQYFGWTKQPSRFLREMGLSGSLR